MNQRNMHRLWETDDLVELVCTELRLATHKRTLASLAQTCRGLSSPALDALWFEQSSILNLVRLLPDGVWLIEKKPIMAALSFMRPLNDAEWIVLRGYAQRIRVLRCEATASFGAAQHVDLSVVYSALLCETQRSGGMLFPSLQALTWPWGPRITDGNSDASCISIFLGPRLQSLAITARLHDMQSLVTPVGKVVAKQLTHFELNFPRENPPPQDLVSAIASSLEAVRVLTIGNLDIGALIHLGRLSSLHTLYLGLPHTGSVALSSIPRRGLPFPALKSLHCVLDDTCCGDLLQFRNLIRTFDGTELTDVHITALHEIPSRALLYDLFSSLADHCDNTSLREIEFSVLATRFLIGSTIAESNITPALLPLLRFPNLQNIEIDLPLGVDVDDAFLTDAAQTWLGLHELKLSRSEPLSTDTEPALPWDIPPQQAPPPQATLCGLSALARHCTNLRSLSLCVDTRVPASEAWPEDMASVNVGPGESDWPANAPCPLENFHVGDSPIPDDALETTALAYFLTVSFPDLRQVYSPHTGLNRLFQDEEGGAFLHDAPPSSMQYFGYGLAWEGMAYKVAALYPVLQLNQGAMSYQTLRDQWASAQAALSTHSIEDVLQSL
ncbi:hypothetical protein MKEN_00980700 [Mycena kentingensis (nom. inval.)]|nr:hypothetical protein MKEN_00980700 [Mycena kentingensis (nom. inval.)]